ncbi:MAG: hypothetical protein KDD56_01610 [Bdellovibrionales bacterium]|nr:hypothetical protein [Bdellovibrionales bacterium]
MNKLLLLLTLSLAPQLAFAEDLYVCTQEVLCDESGVLFDHVKDEKPYDFCTAEKLLYCANLRADTDNEDKSICDSQVSELSIEMEKMQKRIKRLRNRNRRLKSNS